MSHIHVPIGLGVFQPCGHDIVLALHGCFGGLLNGPGVANVGCHGGVDGVPQCYVHPGSEKESSWVKQRTGTALAADNRCLGEDVKAIVTRTCGSVEYLLEAAAINTKSVEVRTVVAVSASRHDLEVLTTPGAPARVHLQGVEPLKCFGLNSRCWTRAICIDSPQRKTIRGPKGERLAT